MLMSVGRILDLGSIRAVENTVILIRYGYYLRLDDAASGGRTLEISQGVQDANLGR